jgi:hypothetical protein
MNRIRRALAIAKESLKTVVHVLLDVAVKKRQSRLIGSEINYNSAKIGDYNGIFDDACCVLAVDLCQLPKVAMEVHGMSIVGAVAHHEAVARALFKDEFAFMRVRLAIDEPKIELASRAGHLLKNQFNRLLRGE